MSSSAPVMFFSNKIKMLMQYRKTLSLDIDERFMVIHYSIFSTPVIFTFLVKTIAFCFTHQVAKDQAVC